MAHSGAFGAVDPAVGADRSILGGREAGHALLQAGQEPEPSPRLPCAGPLFWR